MIRATPIYTRSDLSRAENDVLAARRDWEQYRFEQVSDDEITRCREQWASARARLIALRRARGSIGLVVRCLVLRLAAGVQDLLDVENRYVWVVAFLLGVIAILVVTPVVVFARPSAANGVVMVLMPFIVTVVTSLVIILPVASIGLRPAIEQIQLRRVQLQDEIRAVEADVTRLGRAILRLEMTRDAQEAYERASARQQRLERLLASERYQLQVTDWRALRGIALEDFLGRVFRMLGYEVRTTKASGDQGVDLIVIGKGRRIAVQVKGYEESVGNKAVQEAFTGMRYYDCTECVVIANSQFTSGAIDVAGRVECGLIDGNRIPTLIEGGIY